MAEKAVIIGLFGGLLVSAGVLWAKMPPRPEIYSTHVKQIAKEPRAEVLVIPIQPPAQKEVMPSESIDNRQQHNSDTNNVPETPTGKEVMPDTRFVPKTPDTRPRQVPIPKRRPVGAVNRPHCICKAVVRRIYVLPQANGTFQ